MIELLNNPVFNALRLNDQHLGSGTEKVKVFDDEVSPFAGIEEGYSRGFEEMYEMLPPRKYILYATPLNIAEPERWRLIDKVDGVQMVLPGEYAYKAPSVKLEPLDASHVDEMEKLATLTKPGPFGKRTIEFGYYFGVFEEDRLVAMAGQRMHINDYTEISAVCTHPDHLGKGYAFALVQQQVQLICEQGKTPFLHVRADNTRAIQIYERLGFEIRIPMRFYFMRSRK